MAYSFLDMNNIIQNFLVPFEEKKWSQALLHQYFCIILVASLQFLIFQIGKKLFLASSNDIGLFHWHLNWVTRCVYKLPFRKNVRPRFQTYFFSSCLGNAWKDTNFILLWNHYFLLAVRPHTAMATYQNRIGNFSSCNT